MPDMKTQTINGVVYDIVDQPGRDNLAAHMNNQSNPHMVTAAQIGAAEMTYAKKVGAPHNLLDNSDFRNPVNQRAFTTKESGSNIYTIDRWRTYAGVTVNDGYITLTLPSGRNNFYQYFSLGTIIPGKIYTAAVKYIDGTILCGSTTAVSGSRVSCCTDSILFLEIGANMGGSDHFDISVGAGSASLEWAALYEGEYTAETLPEYQPKGYAAELAECRRYYRQFGTGEMTWTGYTIAGSKIVKILGDCAYGMRANPTVTGVPAGISAAGVSEPTMPSYSLSYNANDQSIRVNLTTALTKIPTLSLCTINFTGLALSADL